MALSQSKKNKIWIFKALNRESHKTMAWVVGRRNKKTLQRLYDKLSHLKATFYTDKWNIFTKVLPQERHIIGKQHTHLIESNNANTRHHLGRMTRRTKVVSKSLLMIELTMKLWVYYAHQENFSSERDNFLSIF